MVGVRAGILLLFLGLSACGVPSPQTELEPPADGFGDVVNRLAPVVQNTCLEVAVVKNCRIRLYVAEAEDGTANAFQSIDALGRPFVVITTDLVAETRNEDELALILAHEAAHHILNHLARQKADSVQASNALGEAARREGADGPTVREAREVGAFVGARLFAQEYELEADALGAIILRRAGFDPLRAVAFFDRIPDPGNHALNSHPSTAERRAAVRKADLRGLLPETALAVLPAAP
ncbi:M48 family metallopeptidase [Cognatishimia maritima]|uniref:Peptidase family M48 n=1 Tax=Cognatishimia maritima TaxID=870908 RepID=A0A1M5KN76_9RHOB|nr:M48 family metallopeptidase [Cognatishimia maritima]SHG54150.1 Peptidase family M48 [Cognatishimia maritima]